MARTHDAAAQPNDTATQPKDSQHIPAKILDRYRKLRALADMPDGKINPHEREAAKQRLTKLEAKHPHIKNAADALDEQEKREAQRQGAQWYPVQPTREDFEELIPDAVQRLGGFFGVDVVDRAQNAFGWAIEQLKEANAAAVEHTYNRGHEYVNAGGLMTLRERLDEELVIEFSDAETDDGEPLVLVELELSAPLWEKLLRQKNGAKAFVDVLRDAWDESTDADDGDG